VGEAPATQEEESKWQEQVREEGDKMTMLLNMYCGCILMRAVFFNGYVLIKVTGESMLHL
jgi:hypothetical protein